MIDRKFSQLETLPVGGFVFRMDDGQHVRKFTVRPLDHSDGPHALAIEAHTRLELMKSGAFMLDMVDRGDEAAMWLSRMCEATTPELLRRAVSILITGKRELALPAALGSAAYEGLVNRVLAFETVVDEETKEVKGLPEVVVENIVTIREFQESNEDRLKRIESRLEGMEAVFGEGSAFHRALESLAPQQRTRKGA